MKSVAHLVAILCAELLPLAVVAAPGDLDTSFNPDLGGLGGLVNTIVTQADGRILCGGTFQFAGTGRQIIRLNPDGTLDPTFSCDPNNDVYCIAVQQDGKILIGGTFTAIAGATHKCVARLHANGMLDEAFNAGAENMVLDIALQDDGKILVGGLFGRVNGIAREGIARLHTDGTLDTDFRWTPTMDISCIGIQTDGQIAITGGNGVDEIVRLQPNGSVDSSFAADAYGRILCVSIQSDGRFVVGGPFGNLNGTGGVVVGRLNANGTTDFNFPTNEYAGYNNFVQCSGLQTDGKILIAGGFLTMQGIACSGFARLHSNGTIETAFNPNIAGIGYYGVRSVGMQADGRILIGGAFSSVDGVSRPCIARLQNGPATQSLTVPGSGRIQWLRGGSSPETQQVSFDVSTDGGASWTPLGAGTRIAGGWEWTGSNLPANGQVRARARTAPGYWNGSTGLVETTTLYALSTPLAEWKLAQTGDANASGDADLDGDGLCILAEYGLNLSPTAPNHAPSIERFDYGDGERLRMFVPRDPAHDDITVSVEATSNLAGSWTTLATSTLGAPFTGPGYVGGDDAMPGVKTVEVRDIVNTTAVSRRWLRVKVTH